MEINELILLKINIEIEQQVVRKFHKNKFKRFSFI